MKIVRLDKSVLYFTQVLEINRSLAGENSLEYAQSLNNLASIYYDNNIEQSERLSLEAKEILLANVGEYHFEYGRCISILGLISGIKGNYVNAEKLLSHALIIAENNSESNPITLVRALSNLAALYGHWMNFDKAERLFLKALEIAESTTGKSDREYLKHEYYLANLYITMGDYGSMEGLLSNILEKQRKLLGENHPDTLETKAKNAYVYLYHGDNDTAESLLKEALNKEDQNSLPFGVCLSTLAYIYQFKGNYEAAESLILRAMKIFANMGRENTRYDLDLMVRLAGLYGASNRLAEAMEIMKKIFVIEDKSIDTLFSTASDSHRLNYVLSVQEILHSYISFVLEYFSNSKQVIMTAMDLVLRRKAIDHEAIKTRNKILSSDKYQISGPKDK